MSNELKLTGEVSKWNLNGHKRHWIKKTIKYKDCIKFFKADRYSAETGVGEQREVSPPHAKKIKAAMLDGDFTPTPISVGIREEDRSKLISFPSDEVACVTLTDKDSLPLIDAGHRFFALQEIFDKGDDKLKEEVLNLDIDATIYLDGSTKKDFLNLQSGRVVDRSHLLSLRAQADMLSNKEAPTVKMALSVARKLAGDILSPFYNQIRFDTRAASGIPINSLSSKNSSDLGTSLVGTAKIALLGNKNADWAADRIVEAFQIIKHRAPDLLLTGRILCPPPGGTRGGATMLIALGNMLAFRLISLNKDKADESDTEALVKSAKKSFSATVDGNFSGPAKRSLLGDFAYNFLADLGNEKEYEGLPERLVRCLSGSTFNVKRPPATPKKKTKPESKQEEVAAPVQAESWNEKEESDGDTESAPWESEG